MAVNTGGRDVRVFHPKMPDPATLPMGQARFTYDGPSDTLFIDFYGASLPAVSVVAPSKEGDRDYLYMRVDPETEQVVGAQVEAFLSYVVGLFPDLAAVLVIADFYDVPDREANRLRLRGLAAMREQQWDANSFVADIGRLMAA